MMRKVFAAMLVACVGAVFANDTMWVPVTYYDFHADNVNYPQGLGDGCLNSQPHGPWEGSNPEFETHRRPTGCGGKIHPGSGCTSATHWADLVTGMVQTNLDAEGKPQASGTTFYNRFVGKWFRPWQPGDYRRPKYAVSCYNGVGFPSDGYSGDSTCPHDTSFKNIIIKDSLPFIDQISFSTYAESFSNPAGDGMYTYHNDHFFPIDGKGFGNEPWIVNPVDGRGNAFDDHNFSFTLEIIGRFKYSAADNYVFRFCGDDDVWVFVNRKLAIDLGGIHSALTDSLVLNNIAGSHGLNEGQWYELHFFLAERHSGGSYATLMTNLPIGRKRRLR
ncbi:MAG: fibro-slime domain-containing protein [Chitinivibrionales bacterium]|nr:fibro-slime domain-containing protein [Chitinivibrionales bacterium]MBD3395130.1 fibro-slime domain-containing protein [Chitinivibrionales bacterium]